LDLKIHESEHHVPGFTSSPIEQLECERYYRPKCLRWDHLTRVLL
jgi:hypothetical protein